MGLIGIFDKFYVYGILPLMLLKGSASFFNAGEQIELTYLCKFVCLQQVGYKDEEPYMLS